MAIFKCKMCGGDLEIIEGAAVAECDYCGTKQTVPKAINENLQSLFNRANTLRIKSEFDKAEKIYEKIIQAEPTQSEAYWGLILCKYGIEYVDDPETFKKIPTCHRASYDSIIADDDYKSAIEHADMSQRTIYEQQAREIDRIQKEILALAQKEETYDVFICYKETDADGQRTQDSAIANDIYYQLTQEGFKVFYSAITLEDKLGSAYEPIIFAALNSAKVMLAIGTRPEYFNAVWVKNEWSRFLKIIKKDRTKLLIPCYRDMDAYELPEEFAHLQAQDMAKIGFINDVVRGIKKVIKKQGTEAPQGPKMEVKTAAPATATVNIAPLLKRAFMFLEDGDWSAADEYCEKVLDQDPENARAYLGKLMAELKVRKQEGLKDYAQPFDDNKNFQKVIRFADDKLKTFLTGCVKFINERNENKRLEGIYSTAVKTMLQAKSANDLIKAAHMLDSIKEYKDAAELYNKWLERATDIKNDEIYNKAMSKLQGNSLVKTQVYTLERAIEEFQSISGWKDADQQIIVCLKKISELKAKEEAERLEKERRAEIAQKKKKRNRMIAGIVSAVVALVIAGVIIFSVVLNTVIIPNRKYNQALSLMEDSEYEKAISVLDTLDGYKDSKDIIAKCNEAILDNKYGVAILLMNAGKYDDALAIFESIKGYKDVASKIAECNTIINDGKYNEAIELMNVGKNTEAISVFKSLEGYKDSDNKIIDCQYNNAIYLMKIGEYAEAIAIFNVIYSHRDSKDKIVECNIAVADEKYDDAVNLMNDGKLEEAYNIFIELGNHKDSAEKLGSIRLAKAKASLKNIKIGNYLKFGVYEQDSASIGKEDIEWYVLDIKNGRALVVSKYLMDSYRVYNSPIDDVTWETCTLRKWLNNDFLVNAFSNAEQAIIPTVTVSDIKNEDYSDINVGNSTQDKIFLLSFTEVKKYFNSNYARQCEATNKELASWVGYSGNGNMSWWLRTTGEVQDYAAVVNADGSINERGVPVNHGYGVRPAMWIDLNP